MLAKGFIRSIAVLIGLVGGSILAAFMGMIDLSAIGDAPLFHVPQPFYFGKPTFDVWSILLMIIISMVSMVESTGVYFALGDITGKNVGEEELKKGISCRRTCRYLRRYFQYIPLYWLFSKCRIGSTFGNQNKKTHLFLCILLDCFRIIP